MMVGVIIRQVMPWVGMLIALGLSSNTMASKLSDLEEQHREASRSWARTVSERSFVSLRVEQFKEAFESRLKGVMRRNDIPGWFRMFNTSSILDWIGERRMLRQIARHDQLTLQRHQSDLEEIDQLRLTEERSLDDLTSRRSALLSWRDAYVASKLKGRLQRRVDEKLVGGGWSGLEPPIDGRVLNLRYLGKASRPGLFFLSRFGTPVRSVDGGSVLFVGDVRGFGKTVIVEHTSSVSVYAHLSKFTVRRLDKIARRQLIGLSGDLSGERVSGLYFELRQADKVVKLRVEE